MPLVPEHHLPGLVHAHHMAPRVAPGHGVDSSAVGSPQTTLQLPSVYIPDVKGSVPGTCQGIASVRAAVATAEQARDDQR